MRNTRRKSYFTKGFPDKLTDAEVEKFHFEGKHPFGLSSARDMGKLLEMMADQQSRQREIMQRDAAHDGLAADAHTHPQIHWKTMPTRLIRRATFLLTSPTMLD